mgnify:CR=1 FL=1
MRSIHKIRVLIVDDHPVFRQGVRQVLQNCEDIEVIGEAENVEKGFSIVRKEHPDVILMDISMPGLNGIDMTRRVASEYPATEVVVFSMHDREGYILQALDAGAKGYVLKGADAKNIIEAIRTVHQNEYFLCAQIRGDIISRFLTERRGGQALRSYDVLSDREQQVFRLLAEGYTTVKIADMLCISPKTVEKHRVNVMKKLKLNNLVELTKYAISLGIVEVEDLQQTN